MSLSHGADTDRLRTIGGNLGDSARATAEVEQVGTSLLTVLVETWAGHDAEQFASSWDPARDHLRAGSEQLSRFAERLRQEADEQDGTSQETTGGGATGPGSSDRAPEGADQDNNDSRDRPRKHFFDIPKPPEYYENHEDPGVGNVDLPDGADENDPAIKELQKTADGRAALDWMERNDITIQYKDDYDGAYYTNETNTMTLGEPPYNDAQTLLHEANHARWDAEDRQVDVEETTRDEYINGKYDEETDCVTQEVYYAKQAREAGTDVDVSTGEQQYDKGYATAYNSAIESGKSPAEAHAAGDEAGRAEIRELFSSGYYKVSGSEPPQTYGEKKGEYWDAQNDWNPFNGI
ncbi:MAG: WXG100 family type VII secretion target [Janibacter sp.]